MKRWNGVEYVEMPRVDTFIEDVIAVCKKHGLSISHEDWNGAFEVEAYSESNADWLRAATALGSCSAAAPVGIDGAAAPANDVVRLPRPGDVFFDRSGCV